MGKALTIAEELGNKAGIAMWLGNIGATYSTVKFEGFDAAKAEEYLLKALAIFTEIGAKSYLVEFHIALSEHYEHEQRLGDAFEHYKKHIVNKDEVNVVEVKKQEAIREQRKAIELAKAAAEARHQATQELLHNVLPPSIAHRMVAGEKLIAEKLPSVSVLFADIVGFTKLSQRITAEELVEGLDRIFSSFDTLAEKHGLEKIKTIGDAYMVVAGAPEARADHAEAMAEFALDMLEAMKEFTSKTTGEKIQLRIGIHSGEVVAGVIGKKKFAYDLWGDAVNTASRMESHGEAGKIHISDDFRTAVEMCRGTSLHTIEFIERGEMDIKGKGIMKTYFLEHTT
jgi:class 3 adenylate cyclase